MFSVYLPFYKLRCHIISSGAEPWQDTSKIFTREFPYDHVAHDRHRHQQLFLVDTTNCDLTHVPANHAYSSKAITVLFLVFKPTTSAPRYLIT